MNEKIELKSPSQDDLDAIEKIEIECFGKNAWSRASLYEFIAGGHSHTVAAYLDGECVGYAGAFVICDEAEITNVAVLPEARRRGIARKMMTALEAVCKSLGARTLLLEVREQNDPAQRLYGSLGFEIDGIRRNYYTMPRDNAVLMRKILDLDT